MKGGLLLLTALVLGAASPPRSGGDLLVDTPERTSRSCGPLRQETWHHLRPLPRPKNQRQRRKAARRTRG